MNDDDYGICIVCGRTAHGSLLCDECEGKQSEGSEPQQGD